MSKTGEELAGKKCKPCEGMGDPLSRTQALKYLKILKNWKLSANGKFIAANYRMKNFMTAVKLIEKIAEISESENHHPDIHLTRYRNLQIDLTTHAIAGLSENDFILAAKIDRLPKVLKSKTR